MFLNLQKTQLLCINDARNYSIDSYLRINNQIIEGQEELKILGYYLSSKPDASAQYKSIKKKAAIRTWAIRHLKKSGVSRRDLVQIYTSFIRSAIEYGCNIYGGFLTTTQKHGIEKIQADVIRVIFGPRTEYQEGLQRAGIATLEERRHLLFLRFASKIEKSPTFSKKWLGKAVPNGHDLRRDNKYKIERARTDRLMKTPIFRMRQILNDLARERKTIDDEIADFEKKLEDKYAPKEK